MSWLNHSDHMFQVLLHSFVFRSIGSRSGITVLNFLKISSWNIFGYLPQKELNEGILSEVRWPAHFAQKKELGQSLTQIWKCTLLLLEPMHTHCTEVQLFSKIAQIATFSQWIVNLLQSPQLWVFKVHIFTLKFCLVLGVKFTFWFNLWLPAGVHWRKINNGPKCWCQGLK